jgi:hypothetical protein
LGAGCIGIVVLVGVIVINDSRRATQDPFIKSLQAAVDTRAAHIDNYCSVDGKQQPSACGPGSGSIMLIGDSHASQWAPALERAANKLGRPLAIRTRGACPVWDLEIASRQTNRASQSCSEFLAETQRAIDRTNPSVVVVASSSYRGRVLDQGDELANEQAARRIWSEGVTSRLRSLEAPGRAILVVLDNPVVPFDPIECLGEHRDATDCTFARSQAFTAVDAERSIERQAAAQTQGASTFDAAVGICAESRCQTLLSDEVVYVDANHLAKGFVLQQAPRLLETLAAAIPT